MQARSLVVLGLLSALAVGMLGIIWRPYVDAGTVAPAVNHFFALAVTLLAIMVPFFGAAQRASGHTNGSLYSTIITSYFLAWNAVISLSLLISTYMDVGYPVFWSGQIIAVGLFAIIITFGSHVGKQSHERETGANLLRRRKETAISELEDMRQRFPSVDGHPEHVSILNAVDALLEELRFLPNHGVADDAGGIFGRTAKWRIAADGFLHAIDGKTDAEDGDQVRKKLVAEASSITRSLANWKR